MQDVGQADEGHVLGEKGRRFLGFHSRLWWPQAMWSVFPGEGQSRSSMWGLVRCGSVRGRSVCQPSCALLSMGESCLKSKQNASWANPLLSEAAALHRGASSGPPCSFEEQRGPDSVHGPRWGSLFSASATGHGQPAAQLCNFLLDLSIPIPRGASGAVSMLSWQN